jgi:DNA repair exonuclease SbcCD nuclease subunit
MKIFHVSDTHLGYSAYARIEQERGLNQREADFYDSFSRFVEISLKERPDIILHSGDLFDSVRPSNRAISFALKEIKKLADAGINFVAISGNHETPRLRETGSVFRILEHLPNCDFAYEDEMKRIDRDGLEILAVPHTSEERFQRSLRAIEELKREKPRLILFHAGVLGLGVFRMNEINELVLNGSDIDPEAKYVALGHYHNHVEVTGNACYSGSTERLSISEAGSEKGFISIDLTAKKRKFISLPTRRMIDIPPLDLKELGGADATKEISRLLDSTGIDGAIVRMTMTGLRKEARKDIDMNHIRRIAQRALNLELRFTGKDEDQVIQSSSPHIDKLEEEFTRYIREAQLGGLDRKRIEKEAMALFAEKEE